MPLGPQMGPMVAPALDPNRMMQIREAAQNGDPQAQQMLQQMSGGAPQGGPPQGGPPPGPPGMSQSQFGNGQPVPEDVQRRRAEQLIQLLRARGG